MKKPSDSDDSKKKPGPGGMMLGMVIAIVAGTLVGGLLPSLAEQLAFLGEMFLNALMMIVVPLVILSMIVGITGLGDIRKIGAIGRRTVLFYMVTTGLSVLIGIVLVNIIQPGKDISPGEKHPESPYRLSGEDLRQVSLSDALLTKNHYNEKYVLVLIDQEVQGAIASASGDSITVKSWEPRKTEGLIYLTTEDGTRMPFHRVDGQLQAATPKLSASGQGIEIVLPLAQKLQGKEGRSMGSTLKEVIVGNQAVGKEGLIPRNLFNAMVRSDILPLIFFSLLIGASLSMLGERGQAAIEVFNTLNEAVMQIVHGMMRIAPLGIFGLVAARIGHAGGFSGFWPELRALGKYSFTVVFGLSLHAVVVLPLILYFIGKRSPLRYAKGMGTALLNAFSTASSSATLPLTMEGVEVENGISNRTASFVLPLGATINMDGTALYEAVAAMFIAQVYGITLGPVQQMVIFITATLAAIGAAGIPEAGLVTMVIVLKAVGLPIEGIGLILTIDWLLDRFRTTVNVWGDSVGAGVIETLEIKYRNND